LAINRPAAPALYRDVVPVVRGAAGLALGGEGQAVDWVLRMAPVPAADSRFICGAEIR
jgi:aminoglycoside phosphotransferase family enzyme